MKLAVSAILLALMLGCTVGTSASADNRWIKVEGGSWSATPETIEKIKEQVKPFMQAQIRGGAPNLQKWSSYTFQYQGREEGGKKFVFVNAFCDKEDERTLNKQMLLVFDGGTCFFNVKYDPVTGKFFQPSINGQA